MIPGDLFRHLRRILGERQTEHALPQCADPACARIFVRTHKGQALCQRCEDSARMAEATFPFSGARQGHGS